MIYNIVIVANEGYVQHAAVMLCSLFEINSDKRFSIYLFTDGICDESINRLRRLCSKYNSSISIVLPEQELGELLDINLKELPVGQWSTMMYYKLFIPAMLPNDAERCLFLDVDMIINDDVETLYNWNLIGAVLAAAEDIPDCIKIKERLGLKQEDKYINSGVMVCDLKLWREIETERPIFDFVNQVKNIIINEQDVIALYFKDKISFLPIRWNMTTFYFNRVPKIFDKYLAELPEAKMNPGIIHFACPIKPWFKDCRHPYRKLYRKYLDMTEWKGYKFPFGEKLNARQRINKYIKNFLNEIGVMKDPMYTKM